MVPLFSGVASDINEIFDYYRKGVEEPSFF